MATVSALILPDFGCGQPDLPPLLATEPDCSPLPSFLWKSLRISLPYSAHTFSDGPYQLCSYSCDFQNRSMISGLVVYYKALSSDYWLTINKSKSRCNFCCLALNPKELPNRFGLKASCDQPIKGIFGARLSMEKQDCLRPLPPSDHRMEAGYKTPPPPPAASSFLLTSVLLC